MSEHNQSEEQHAGEVSEDELEAVSGGTYGLLALLIDYVVRPEPDTDAAPPPQ